MGFTQAEGLALADFVAGPVKTQAGEIGVLGWDREEGHIPGGIFQPNLLWLNAVHGRLQTSALEPGSPVSPLPRTNPKC